MKRIVTAALAAATLMAPLAVPAEATAHERDRYYHDGDRDHDQGRGYRDHDDWDRGYRDSDRRTDRYGRDLRRAIRREHWNARAYNGYTYRGQWFYGAPPAAYFDDPYYDPGYRTWRRTVNSPTSAPMHGSTTRPSKSGRTPSRYWETATKFHEAVPVSHEFLASP